MNASDSKALMLAIIDRVPLMEKTTVIPMRFPTQLVQPVIPFENLLHEGSPRKSREPVLFEAYGISITVQRPPGSTIADIIPSIADVAAPSFAGDLSEFPMITKDVYVGICRKFPVHELSGNRVRVQIYFAVKSL